jgi:ABC-type multidrug transport system ATPase subunit
MTDVPALLEARGLVKHLGGRPVVNGVDLVCHAGQVLGLLGPNGAGKTTTLRMLYGFLSADVGVIRFDGVDTARDVMRFKRQLGVCTQEDTFDGDFTDRENLTIAAGYFRPRPPDVRGRVDELLELAPAAAPLPGRADHGPSIPTRAWRCGTSSMACVPRDWASCSPRTTWTRPSG